MDKVERRYRKLGFSGRKGAVDGAGWDWENCLNVWQGLFTEKKENLAVDRK